MGPAVATWAFKEDEWSLGDHTSKHLHRGTQPDWSGALVHELSRETPSHLDVLDVAGVWVPITSAGHHISDAV
jgi:hypothetical protein